MIFCDVLGNKALLALLALLCLWFSTERSRRLFQGNRGEDKLNNLDDAQKHCFPTTLAFLLTVPVSPLQTNTPQVTVLYAGPSSTAFVQ